MARQNLENEELGGVIRAKINDNFSELYSVSDGLGTASIANIGTGAGQVIGTDEARSYFDIAPRTSIQPTLSSNFSRNKHERYEVYGNEPKTILQQWDVDRNSTATYIDANGVLQTAPIHQPRIDYSTGEGRLLVEGQSTNLHLDSWRSAKTAGSLIHDQEPRLVTPDGTANGFVWERTPATSVWGHGFSFTTTSLIGQIMGGSVFIKPLTFSKSLDIYFGRSNGTEGRMLNFSFTSGGGITTTSSDVKIIPYPNGWFRLCFWQICGGPSTTIVYFAQSSEMKFAAWGLQIEPGLPSSYIPTTTSAVTRVADIITPKGDA